MLYIGVNNPVVTISGKGEIDLEAKGIVIENCEFSEDTMARFAVKEKNKDTVERNDTITNKDPLYLKNGEPELSIVNSFVELYHLNNPTPLTTSQMKEYYIKPMFRDSKKIILTGQYLNFTYTTKDDCKFATVVTAQSKHAAKSIEKHNHILCYTEDNKGAFASGCLFNIGLKHKFIMGEPHSAGSLQIYIRPEKYTEFLEKFAVTSLIAVPCRENVGITDLTRMAYNKNPALDDIIPLIYIDMEKVVADMCEKLGKTVGTLEYGFDKRCYCLTFDLGDYGIYNSPSHYSDISDFKYNDYTDTANIFENRYTNNIFTATDNYVNAIMNLLK